MLLGYLGELCQTSEQLDLRMCSWNGTHSYGGDLMYKGTALKISSWLTAQQRVSTGKLRLKRVWWLKAAVNVAHQPRLHSTPDGSPLRAGPSTEPTHNTCSLNLRLTSVRILTPPFSSQAILEKVLNILACMPVLSHVMWPHGLEPARLLCSRNFSGKDTGVGCHFHLQGTFPTQGRNPSLPCFLHYRQVPSCWATGEESLTSWSLLFLFFNL